MNIKEITELLDTMHISYSVTYDSSNVYIVNFKEPLLVLKDERQ